jgi:hypothetical protein
MPSWQVFQIGIWLRISRAWRILKKFGKFSGGNLAVFEILRSSKNSKPIFGLQKSAKASCEKILQWNSPLP